MKKYWIVLLGICIAFDLSAQLSKIEYLAKSPDSAKFVLDILDTDALFYSGSFAPSEVVINDNGENRINFSPVLNQLEPHNDLLLDLKVNSLGGILNHKNWRLVVGHNLRYLGASQYSEELATISALGNAGYIGETIDLGPSFIYSHFHELYLGMGVDIGKWRVGGKIRMIAGNEFLRTEETEMNLTTGDQSFVLTIDSDFAFFSSSTLQYRGIDEVDTDFDPGVYNSFLGDNQGLGFDFGMSYSFSNQLIGYAHLEGLGSIRWDKRTDLYSKQGKEVYQGVDLLDYLSDEIGVTVTDSIYSLLDFENEKDLTYSDRLPLTYQLGLEYQFSRRNTIELIVGRINYQINTLSTWMIAYQRAFGSNFLLLTRISGVGRSPANIGVGFGWSLGPVSVSGNISNILGITDLLSTRYNQLGLKLQVRI